MSESKTRVVNVKEEKEKCDIYIGRPARGFKGSKWRNPFKVGKDGTREECIEKYRLHIESRPDLLAALPELKGKALGCWCKPAPCHGDVLVELVERL